MFSEENENLNEDKTFEKSSVSILINRKTNITSSYEIGLAVCIPRKRTNVGEKVRWKLQYYSFLDDKRSLNNIDSILNRLITLDVVHICCTESALAGKNTTEAAQKRFKEITTLLSKVSELVSTYQDPNDIQQVSNTIPSLPKELISLQGCNDYLDTTLKTLLEEESYLQYLNNKSMTELAKKALGVLLLESGNTTSEYDGTYRLEPGDLSSHLTFDRTAMECINLLPSKKEMSSNKGPTSIYDILNKCQTKMGSSLLQTWCRQPLINLNQINLRHDFVEYLINDSVTMDLVRESLKGLVNLDDVIQKLLKKGGGLRQLYKLYLFVDQSLPLLIQALPEEGGTELLREYMEGLMGVYNMCGKFHELVQEVLDLEKAPEEFLVKTSHSEELAELREQLNQIEVDAEDLLKHMNGEWSNVSEGQIRLEVVNSTSDVFAWRFRLTNTKHFKVLNSQFKDVALDVKALKNGVNFTTKELKQLSDEKNNFLETYREKQSLIVDKAMEVVETYLPVFERASLIVAELDVLASFAHVAAHSPFSYVRPEMTDEVNPEGLGIVLEQGRHPVVELQEDQSFIPNDFDLRYGKSNFLIITGPNMGGKSTYIRSLAAIVTMAQIGSFVPCTQAKINIMHSILARVGAGDAQQRGISTFMAEMLEASSILSRATKRSLIVIDELGRGTSTFDGFGLAWAISEYIATKLESLTVFATHFHELTRLEKKVQGVVNKHVTAVKTGKGSLTFLYEVQPGPCLESFGIQVAEMANFPSSVIERAKRKAAELENFYPKNRKRLFLEKFKQLPIGSVTDRNEILEATRILLQEFNGK